MFSEFSNNSPSLGCWHKGIRSFVGSKKPLPQSSQQFISILKKDFPKSKENRQDHWQLLNTDIEENRKKSLVVWVFVSFLTKLPLRRFNILNNQFPSDYFDPNPEWGKFEPRESP